LSICEECEFLLNKAAGGAARNAVASKFKPFSRLPCPSRNVTLFPGGTRDRSTVPIAGNQQTSGNLTVLGIITGQRRSALTADTSQSYMLPLQNFRIWDEFDRPLPDTSATSGLVVAQLRYDATIADTVFFVANRDYRVVGITGRVEVAGTGGACTAVIKKAASATAIASGTALHSSTFNLVGTAATNQVLTVSTTLTVLAIPSGTCIGFDLTGTPTSAVGTISVFLIPISPDDLAITSGAIRPSFSATPHRSRPRG
jgi:hypothetical protein